MSQKDKRRNKEISSLRVIVEHTIGGVKPCLRRSACLCGARRQAAGRRFRVVSDIYRNLKQGFEDKVMELACGLWNYHLKKA